MDERLRGALGSVRAGEALKDRTKAYLAAEIAGRKRRGALPVRRLAPVLACLILLLAGFGGYQFYFTPVAAIRVEINPSLELGVNRLGRVVTAQGLNEDGEALAQEVDVRFLTYEEALERLLASSAVGEPLESGDLLTIEVVGDDEARTQELLAGVESCTAGHGNISCCAGSTQEAAQAAAAGLSLAKYRIYEEIRELEPDFPAQEAAALTMRELRDRLASLQGGAQDGMQGGAQGGEAPSSSAAQESRPGGGSGHRWETGGAGHGTGHGAGQGHGAGEPHS